MKATCGVLAISVLLCSICWLLDRQQLASQLSELQQAQSEREMRQDEAECNAFESLVPGARLDESPNIVLLADEVLVPGDAGYERCCKFLTEYAPDPPADFEGCTIYFLSVSLDAVPGHGGDYIVAARDGLILIAYQASAIIGG